MDVAALYEQHAQELYRFARSRLRSIEDAEDVVHATFETLLRHPEYDATRHILYRIAQSRIVDLVRSQRSQTQRIERAWQPDTVAPDAVALDGIMADDMLRAITHPIQQQAIRLRHVDGYSIKEAAALMHTTRGAIKAACHRGLDVLRHQI